jgi:tetratricopeptide (TPR) repeat protein
MAPHTTGTAFINGVKIDVMFDTGASTSILSMRAAARAGVRPDGPGVADAGYSSGIGRGTVKTYIAPFASFKIGDDEEIKNARLRIADTDFQGDMLIGADFFLSHHVLVSNSQRRLYLTYNGGPVFNLSRAASAAAAPNATQSADDKDTEPALADAAAYSRRGTAFAGRRDFEHALKDLTRACELSPDNPEFLQERGMVYWENKQIDPARADFDRALSLNPDYLPALASRAQLRLRGNDLSGAQADLSSADRVAPKQADVRFTLAELDAAADLQEAAVAQYDLWIASHPDDSKMAKALNGRCWSRALQGRELDQALTDCNRALSRGGKAGPMAAATLDSRGLVRLRLGAYDKSIDDYDASLKASPQNAWALYGRGLAKLRKKNTVGGEADIADAVKIWPGVAEEFTRRGLNP